MDLPDDFLLLRRAQQNHFFKFPKEETAVAPWKVLVVDEHCRALLAPILSVKQLHDRCITLVLPLNGQQRQKMIEDTPAVYLMQPTLENIQRLAQDMTHALYQPYYIYFSEALSNELLTEFARLVVERGTLDLIHQVADRALNFVALDESIFHVGNIVNSYQVFNSPGISDKVANATLEQIVDALMMVCARLHILPVIRYARSNPMLGMIAERLHAKLALIVNEPVFTRAASMDEWRQTVLILVDRNDDLRPMVQHTWDYQPMLHDVLNMKANQVDLPEEAGKKKDKTVIDITDPFYHEVQYRPWTDVDAKVKTQIERIKTMLEVPEPKVDYIVEENLAFVNKQLANAQVVPELKRKVYMHTNLALELAKQVESRSLKKFYDLEEEINKTSSSEKHFHFRQVLSLISEQDGLPTDKLRLVVFFLLQMYSCNVDLDNMADMLSNAVEKSTTVSSSSLFKWIVRYCHARTARTSIPPITGIGDGVAASIVKRAVGTVANFLGFDPNGKYPSRIVKIVDDVMMNKPPLASASAAVSASQEESDSYDYLDPRYHLERAAPRHLVPFRNAIVFVVGGGNYKEHADLMQLAREKDKQQQQRPSLVKNYPHHIVYGSTELLTSEEFLKQVSDML